MDDVYAVKKIAFLGKPVTTICQSINGPCPLLAICNVLLLRGHLAIDECVTPDGLISAHDLMRVVQNRLVSTNPLVPGSSDLAHLTREKTLEDVISLLPSLLVGLDVNVRFHKITDFEYTVECAVFDMLDIALVHGWLLDAQDVNTLRVVQNKSYNELVAQLVEYRSVLMTEASSTEASTETTLATTELAEPAEASVAVTTEPLQAAAPVAETPSPSSSALPEPIAAEVKTFPSLAIDTDVCNSSSDNAETAAESLVSPTAALSLASSPSPSAATQRKSPSKKTVQVMMQERAISDADAVSTATVLLEDGPVLEDFFAASASQLTYYGLVQLHEHVRERQLCVFFRNNHFSTLFKYNGALYLLVTDTGYLDEPTVVWERLDEIDGDSEYYDATFRPLNASETKQQRILTRQEEIVQRERVEQRTQGSADAKAASSSSHDDRTNNDDPDYLLALRLQHEEDARVKRVSPAISPRRPPSPVGRPSSPVSAPAAAAAVPVEEYDDVDANANHCGTKTNALPLEDGGSNATSNTVTNVDASDELSISADGEVLMTESELAAQQQAERFYQERKRQQDQHMYELQHQQLLTQQHTLQQQQQQQTQTQTQTQQQQQRAKASTSRSSGRPSKSDTSDCCVM